MPHMGPILLAVDRRGSAAGAIDAAAELAVDLGVPIEVLIVGDAVLRSTHGWEDTAEEVAASLRERGIEATAALRHGAPADVIVARAIEVDASMIVLGSRGRMPRSLLLGSTSRAVAARADRSVLVVPQSYPALPA